MARTWPVRTITPICRRPGAVAPRPHGIHPRPVERPDGRCHILTTNNLFTCQRAALGTRPQSLTLVPQITGVSTPKKTVFADFARVERKKQPTSRRFACVPDRARWPIDTAVTFTAATQQPIVTSTSVRARHRTRQIEFIPRFGRVSSRFPDQGKPLEKRHTISP